jgi:hypothetical protein
MRRRPELQGDKTEMDLSSSALLQRADGSTEAVAVEVAAVAWAVAKGAVRLRHRRSGPPLGIYG